MAGFMKFMDRQPKWLIVVAGLLLVILIGIIDYLTGDYSLLIFYLMPISLVSWFAGHRAGLVIAFLSGCARFTSDFALAVNIRHLYWNSLEEGMFLLIVALLISLLRHALEKE